VQPRQWTGKEEEADRKIMLGGQGNLGIYFLGEWWEKNINSTFGSWGLGLGERVNHFSLGGERGLRGQGVQKAMTNPQKRRQLQEDVWVTSKVNKTKRGRGGEKRGKPQEKGGD